MASVFKNSAFTDVTVLATVYSPGNPVAIVIGLVVTNVGATEATVTVRANGAALVKDAKIPIGASLSPILNKMVLENAQEITVESDIVVDVITSAMEITA